MRFVRAIAWAMASSLSFLTLGWAQSPVGLERAGLTPIEADCAALSDRLKQATETMSSALWACAKEVPAFDPGNYNSVNFCGRSRYTHRICVPQAQAYLCTSSHWASEVKVCYARARALTDVRRAAENELLKAAEDGANSSAPGIGQLYKGYRDFREKLERGQLAAQDLRTTLNGDNDWRNRKDALVRLGTEAAGLASPQNQLASAWTQEALSKLGTIVDAAQRDLDEAVAQFDQALATLDAVPYAEGYEPTFAQIKVDIDGTREKIERARGALTRYITSGIDVATVTGALSDFESAARKDVAQINSDTIGAMSATLARIAANERLRVTEGEISASPKSNGPSPASPVPPTGSPPASDSCASAFATLSDRAGFGSICEWEYCAADDAYQANLCSKQLNYSGFSYMGCDNGIAPIMNGTFRRC